MPLYFFHTRAAGKIVKDKAGQYFESLDAAVSAARVSVKELLADPQHDQDARSVCIEITDQIGSIWVIVPVRAIYERPEDCPPAPSGS